MARQSLSPMWLRFGTSVLVWLILPASLSFGTTSTSDSALAHFRSSPTNDFYDGMFVCVTAALALVHAFVALTQYRYLNSGKVLCDDDEHHVLPVSAASVVCLSTSAHPISALYGFELLLLLALTALNFVAGMVASGALWTVACLALSALHFRFYRWCLLHQETQRLCWIDAPPVASLRRAVFSFFYILWGVAFLAFPVFQSWSGPPEPFVRWYAFTENGELVWRGIFASYALAFLTCVLDPFNRHALFIMYVAVSGLLHATFMLAANLYSNARGLANGNREHLFGDIGGWFVIALFSAAMLIGVPLSLAPPVLPAPPAVTTIAADNSSDSAASPPPQVPLASLLSGDSNVRSQPALAVS